MAGSGSVTSDEFVGVLDSQVPHPTFTDAEADANNEFVERLEDNGTHTGLIVIAPHGGDIEPQTDEQAERVASRLAAKGVSLWRCKGFKAGRRRRCSLAHHLDRNSRGEFPHLNSVISRGFTYAVAFHGFNDPEVRADILIGGAAPASLKQEIETAIKGAIAGSDITVRIASADEKFGGDSPRNIVNRLTAGGANGIQIEQTRRARSSHGEAIADAVATSTSASSVFTRTPSDRRRTGACSLT